MDLKENIKKLLRYPYSLLPYKYRLHPSYFLIKNFLKKKKLDTKTKIKTYQLMKIKQIVEYAYKYCPGYYYFYKDKNLGPKDLNSLADFKHFPLITKEILRDNLKEFVSRDSNLKKKFYVTTSGSSGIPFGFYNTKEENAIELGFIHNAWESVGWSLGDKSIVLRGSFIGSEKNLYYYNPSTRELHISTYFLKQRTYNDFKELFFLKKIKDIQAFPSAIINLANLVIDNNDIGKFDIRFVFLGSENFNVWQKNTILKAFPKVKIFIWYGLTEKCVLALKHPKNEYYEVCNEYGYSEILSSSSTKGEKIFRNKEIIATSFFMKATPFIRYKTLDYASGEKDINNSISKIHKIEGRMHEYILTYSKKKIYVSSWSSIMHDDIFDMVKEFQFFQNRPGIVILNIVPKKNFQKTHEENIYNSIQNKFKKDLDILIKKVSHIKKSKNNKYSFIVNNLKK